MSTSNDEFETPSLSEQVSSVRREFAATFGYAPKWIAAAPGRVNLIGEHTDYNAGFVFPLAIERYTVVAGGRGKQSVASALHASPSPSPADRGGELVRVRSTLLGETAEFVLDRLEPDRRDWTSYIRGVLAGCIERGLQSGSIDMLVDSKVPLGSGLSSSAALEVATATLVEAVTGRTLEPVDKARLCQRAEHEYAGMPCGIMDQFSSAMGAAGKLLLIDCRSETAELVPLDDPRIAVLVVNSNVRHELTGSEYPERRSQCEEAGRRLRVATLREVMATELEAKSDQLAPLQYRRARHVVGEIERTLAAAAALRTRDWPRVGELMYASHASLRDDYEVSCAELDALVEIAATIGPAGGVIGSRMTGGGFGGCMVSLVASGREREIAQRIVDEYKARTGIAATAFVTKPARGAHVVESADG